MVEWVFFILLHIIGYSAAQALLKHITKKYSFDLNGLAFASFVISVLLLSPILIFYIIQNPVISSTNEGYIFLLLSIATNSIALFLLFRAVKVGELSVVGPLDTLRPLFVTFLGILILSEVFKLNIFIAAILSTAGAFLIHYKSGFSSTLKNIKGSKASLLILANTAVQSLSAIFDKIALNSIQPFILTFFLLFGIMLVYGSIVASRKIEIKQMFNTPVVVMGIIKIASSFGIVSAVALVSPAVAITAQMSRSIVMALLGYFIFDEKEIVKKIIGAAIMLAGVALLFL